MDLINYKDNGDTYACVVCHNLIKNDIWTCKMCDIKIDKVCYDNDRCPNCNTKEHYEVENSVVDNKNVFVGTVDFCGNLIDVYGNNIGCVYDSSANILDIMGSIMDLHGITHGLSGEIVDILNIDNKYKLAINGEIINTPIYIYGNETYIYGNETSNIIDICGNIAIDYNNSDSTIELTNTINDPGLQFNNDGKIYVNASNHHIAKMYANLATITYSN